jgi:large repetitive protein
MEFHMSSTQVSVSDLKMSGSPTYIPALISDKNVQDDPDELSSCGRERYAGRFARSLSALRHGMGRWIGSRIVAVTALLLMAAGAQAQFGTVAVGTAAGQQNVTVTAQAAGTVASVKVLTAGVASLDFTAGSGTACGTPTLAVGGTCTQSVAFTPAAPGLRIGAVVLLDASSNVLGTAYLTGIGSGGLGVLVPGNVLDVAGNGTYTGSVLDGNQAAAASLYLPTSVVLDGAGNMYIADSGHNRIRKVTAPATGSIGTGIISTIAGNGDPTYSGDGGPAVDATLNAPSGIAIDGAGNLYIADTGDNRIREINASTGIITTVAGTGAIGSSGDGGAATAAELNQPQGVSVDASGNLYIADTNNHRIREVKIATGIITTVAGDGFTNPNGTGGYAGDGGAATAAELNYPYAVAFDAAGNMYIPDSANYIVRKVSSSGTITTFAGTPQSPGYSGDGSSATAATMYTPEGVIADPAGNIYIATGGNRDTASIRKVSSLTGDISTLVENNIGEDYNNGLFAAINIYGPIGLFVDGSGNLYLADSLNMIVQQIQSNFVALNFTQVGTRQGEISAPQSQTVENDGNAPLDVTNITVGANVALDAATTTCTDPSSMTVDEDCVVGVEFAPPLTPAIAPPATSETLTGNVDVVEQAVNTPLDIEVIGIATVINSTTTTLTSNPNPSGFGQGVTFTATVTTGAGTGALTGNVTFTIDGTTTTLCPNPVAVNAGGIAQCVTSALSVGAHKVTAAYGNDPGHYASTSPVLTQTVIEGTTTVISSSKNPSDLGQSVTFIATVSVPPGGGSVTPDGTVVFYDGSTILGTEVLNTVGVTGVATLSTAALTNGQHTISADYEGDASNQIQGSSATLIQDVLAPSGISITSSPNPSTYGTTVTFTVTAPSTGTAPATGMVNILDGSTQIGTVNLAGSPGTATFTTSTLAVGSHSMTAVYMGDSNYGPGTSSPITQVVNQVLTTTTVAAAPNPGYAGGAIAITATVTPAVGVATPTGTVTFTSGTTTLGTATLGATGTATINPTFAVGTYSIVATYAGTTNDAGSASASLSLTITIATTSTALVASPSPGIVDSPVTFTAKVTGNGGIPGGTVTFSADGSALSTPVTLDATGTATLTYSTLTAGTHSITANYSGDANDLASSATISLVVGTIPTATALGSTTSGGTPEQVSLVAAVVGVSGPTPTGTVTFTNGTTVIGTATLDSSGVATLNPNLATGTYSIVATYSGDALHSPSASQPVTVLGTPSGFSFTVNPPTMTLATSQNGSATLSFVSIAGFTDTLGLGCSSLPAAVNCHFSSAAVTLAADGTQTAQVTIDTNNPLSGGTSAMNSQSRKGSALLAGLSVLSLPITILFGLIAWRFRRRYGTVFTAILILLLSGAAILMNGCSGGFSQSTAAPGTYVIQITATGTNSDVIHYQNVTLTITQ